MDHKFNLGQKVKSKVSVESGSIVRISFSVHQQPMYCLSYTTHEGYYKEEWFYEEQLELVS